MNKCAVCSKPKSIRNKKYCSRECFYSVILGKPKSKLHRQRMAKSKIGVLNPQWKGDNASDFAGRDRAKRLYPLEPCEICGSKKSERHHVDGDTLNNERANIQFLCRKHHMEIDGRKTGVDLGGRHFGEAQHNSKLTENDVLELRSMPPETGSYVLARKYGVSPYAIWAARTGKTWKHLPMPN